MKQTSRPSRTQEYSLAFAAPVLTANAHYIHPIIGDVAAHFGVNEARIGIVLVLTNLRWRSAFFCSSRSVNATPING